jgi:hypothetical protein
MREIADGLHDPFPLGVPNLVEQERENNRHGHAPQDVVYAQQDRVLDEPEKVHRVKEQLEVFQANPGATPDALTERKVLKGDDDAVHGDIGKKYDEDQGRKNQNMQKDFIFEILEKRDITPPLLHVFPPWDILHR